MTEQSRPVLLIPDDIILSASKVFGHNEIILPLAHTLVHEHGETWDAIRCALDNLESGYLQTTHVRYTDGLDDKVMSKGGGTIVFPIPQYRSNLVTIAVSWCHENDTFNPKIGRFLAALNHAHGRCIQMRLPRKGNYSRQLKLIFRNTQLNKF